MFIVSIRLTTFPPTSDLRTLFLIVSIMGASGNPTRMAQRDIFLSDSSEKTRGPSPAFPCFLLISGMNNLFATVTPFLERRRVSVSSFPKRLRYFPFSAYSGIPYQTQSGFFSLLFRPHGSVCYKCLFFLCSKSCDAQRIMGVKSCSHICILAVKT